MNLIALAGFKDSGKDTAGRFLVENYGFTNFSFAESLKDACAAIFCWDRELLEGATKESRVWRETVDEWWATRLDIPDFTPRLALQLVGTDVFRDNFHTDIWTLNIERKITQLGANTNVVLCDGRFPNELNLARKFGGKIIRVKRGVEPEWFNMALLANGFKPNDSEFMEETYADLRHDIRLGYFAFDAPLNPEALKKYARRQMADKYEVHESEWAWIGQPFDATIENDLSIEHLHSETIRFL